MHTSGERAARIRVPARKGERAQRETETETERQTDRDRQRERQRETERDHAELQKEVDKILADIQGKEKKGKKEKDTE